MKFTLTIELGNDAMRTYGEMRTATRAIGTGHFANSEIRAGESGAIRDINGNTVGKWEVTNIEVREDIQQDSIATLLWDYLKRDPDNKDRRQTGYGTKTKQGLYLSISNILKQTGGLR